MDLVFDWGGENQTCKDAAIRMLQEQNLWPKMWPEDGSELRYQESHIAVRDTYKLQNQPYWFIPDDAPDREGRLAKLHLDLHESAGLRYTPMLRYCKRDDMVIEGEELDYWLMEASTGTPVRYPFGTALPSETDIVAEAAAVKGRPSSHDPNNREKNNQAFWSAIRLAHFDSDGELSTADPVENGKLKELGATGNLSEVMRNNLQKLVPQDITKARSMYAYFCDVVLARDSAQTLSYIDEMLGEKKRGHREKQASAHALDGRDNDWREREAEFDDQLDHQ